MFDQFTFNIFHVIVLNNNIVIVAIVVFGFK